MEFNNNNKWIGIVSTINNPYSIYFDQKNAIFIILEFWGATSPYSSSSQEACPTGLHYKEGLTEILWKD